MKRAILQRSRNEGSLLAYSVKMLAGPGLVAVALIAVVLVTVILTTSLDTFGTRLATMLFNLETFAPLLGVVLFSGLLGADLRSGCLDNLRSSGEGITRVILRKIFHSALLTAAACLFVLCLLRLVYTSFNVLWAMGVIVPAAWYFGALGLVAAAATRRSLAGFTAGTALLILAISRQQVTPLLLQSYSERTNLANLRLLADGNWLIAKVYFLLMALVLAILAAWIIRGRREAIPGCLAAAVLIVVTSAGTHWLWARPVALAEGAGEEMIDVRKIDGVRRVRFAVSAVDQGPSGRRERTLIRERRYTRTGEDWTFASDVPFHPTSECDLLHIDLTCAIDPDAAAITATARLELRVLQGPLDRVFVFLAQGLQLTGVDIDGAPADHRRRQDLLEVNLPAPINPGDPIDLGVSYAGPLADIAEGVSPEFIALFDRWFPATRDRLQNWVDPFTCRVDVRLPKPWGLAGATVAREDSSKTQFTWESPIPIHRIPMCAGIFREYGSHYRDIPVTLHAFTIDDAYAERLLNGCVDILRAHEDAFGPYPHPRLAFVEDRFQSASGVGHPGMMTLRSDRTETDHATDMFDLLLPHEIAHQWWRLGLPKWLAEGGAVYANYRYIDRQHGSQAATTFLHDSIYTAYLDSQSVMEPLVTDYRNNLSMYARGGSLFVALESVVGKKALADVLRKFLDRHRFDSQIDEEALNRDLERSLQGLAGNALPGFVSDWIRSPKRFDPSVNRLQNMASDAGYIITVDLEHKGGIQFPTRVRLGLADGSSTNLLWPAGDVQTTLRLASAQAATDIQVDPEQCLLDWNRQNNYAVPTIVLPTSQPDLSRSIARWQSFTTQDGLCGPISKSLWFGWDHKLYAGFGQRGWIGGKDWNLNVFDGHWQTLIPDPEFGVTILAMAQSREGVMWYGGHGSLWSVHADDARQWILAEQRFGDVGRARFAPNPQANSTIPGSDVHALLLNRNEELWVGTDHGASVYHAADDSWQHFGPEEGLKAQAVLALAEDHDGVLWAGTSHGVYTFEDGRWMPHPDIAGSDLVLAIATDTEGALWFGTCRSGIVVKSERGLRQFTSANSDLIHDLVTSLVFDPDGRLWVGGGMGLGCFDGQTWTHFDPASSGLPSPRIHRLVVDDHRQLWIGTDVGLTRYEL